MTLLAETCARIQEPSASVANATQRLLDAKTKPRRSLGRLEEVAVRVAAITRDPVPALPRKAVVVMGADHGVAAAGVSAYPQEVTAQMLLNIAGGGAAINVLAQHAGAEVVVVDMGTVEPVTSPLIRALRIGAGTHNFAEQPAMSASQAVRAVEAGIELACELIDDGVGLLGIGEMGIGNTTAASALVATVTGLPVAEVTGRGTGIDDVAWRRKVSVIQQALALHRPNTNDPMGVLAAVGGFEIGGLAGVVLGAASRGVPVVMDGFIASTSALLAAQLAPAARGYLLASHRSVEVGHRKVLEALGSRPLLDLDLRLGEGTGAALAMSLVDAALKILHDMATFESAGVSDTGQ